MSMKYFSRVLLIIAVLSLSFFILQRFAQINLVWEALLQAKPIALLPAAILTIAVIDSQIRVLQKSLRSINVTLPYADVAKIWLSSYFVNVVVPSGSFAGIAYAALQGSRWQIEKTDMIVGSILQVFSGYLAFLTVLTIAVLLQFTSAPLSGAVGYAVGILGAVVLLIFLAILIIASRLPTAILILRQVRSLLNQFFKLKLKVDDIYDSLYRASLTLAKFSRRWQLIGGSYSSALIGHIFGLGIFWSAFLALGYPVSPSALITGYVVVNLFTIVSVTPAGLGFVEVITPLTLATFNIPISISTAAVLIYRAFSLWFVLAVGGYTFRHIEKVELKQNTLTSARSGQ